MEPFKAAKMLIMAAIETAPAPGAAQDVAHHFGGHARGCRHFRGREYVKIRAICQ